MTHPRISAIAALDEVRTIGVDGRLPWRIPEDSRRFRQLTMGHPVIIGRKTYESIGRRLDGRTVIVVTRNNSYHTPDGVVVHSLDEGLRYAKDRDEIEVFIGGGEAIYREALDLCDRLYLTLVKGKFGGTVKFPDYAQFDEVISRSFHRDAGHEYEFAILGK